MVSSVVSTLEITLFSDKDRMRVAALSTSMFLVGIYHVINGEGIPGNSGIPSFPFCFKLGPTNLNVEFKRRLVLFTSATTIILSKMG